MRRPSIAAFLVLVGLLVGACQPVPYSAGSGPKVFRTGDSVLWLADDEVRTSLQAAGFRTASAVYPGTQIGWSADRTMEQVWGDGGRQAPDAILVASGNMNVLDGWTPDDADQVRRLLEWANPEARCTVWVLPAAIRHPSRSGEDSYFDPHAEAVADAIRRSAAARGAHVVDWDSVAARHPEWFVQDGVHHNDAGQAAYADFVVRELRRVCGI